MSIPTLFKLDVRGTKRYWKCWLSDGNIINIQDGIDDPNAKVKNPVQKTITENTLRSAEEQAWLKIQKLWISKVLQDYKPDPTDEEGLIIYNKIINEKEKTCGAMTGILMFDNDSMKGLVRNPVSSSKDKNLSSNSTIPVMLAKNWFKPGSIEVMTPVAKKLITSPDNSIFIQPKLDGIRCLAFFDKNIKKVRLISRSKKDFPFIQHIKDDLRILFETNDNFNLIIDGELYFNGAPGVEKFQFTSEIAKIRKEPHPAESKLQYWIFDVVDETMNFKDRFSELKIPLSDSLVRVTTILVTDESPILEQIDNFYKFFAETEHFEGVMIREGNNSVYENGRQSSLLKYKKFEDEEWTIIGASQSDGGLQDGSVVWKLEKDGVYVDAKQVGNVEVSKTLFLEKEKHIGKLINIRYNEKTKDGIPRFPRAIAFVEDK